MLVLFETAGGFAIFKLLDKNKLTQSENLYIDFETVAGANKVVSLKYFHKFEDIAEAVLATNAFVEGKLCKSLKKTLKKCCGEMHEQLAVADVKLGNAIKDKLGLQCVSNTAVQDLMRCIRSQLDGLITENEKRDIRSMRLGLAHSLSRYKLKYSTDKVDIMVVHSIALLDEMDKEINNYAMRCREWYGWHFPELSKIVKDNMTYLKTVYVIGCRDNAENCDMSDFLPEEVEAEVKDTAEVSMGTEYTEQDVEYTRAFCHEILEFAAFRTQLHMYVTTRMMSLAPNLSILVGELVGARLIEKAGSLIKLAKQPASTLQILGSEKALFRALKTKKDTPKYGLIYHAQLIGQTSRKNKGKMSRMLAAKAVLAARFDALGDNVEVNCDFGTEHKAKLMARLQFLEEGNIRKISGTAKAKAKFDKYHSKEECAQYSVSVDSTLQSNMLTNKNGTELEEVNEEPEKKKKKKKTEETAETPLIQEVQVETESTDISKKKKKKKRSLSSTITEEEQSSAIQIEAQEEPAMPKKKKKKHADVELKTEETAETPLIQEVQVETESTDISKKKKKKKRSLSSTITEEEQSSAIQVEAQEEPAMTKKKKKKHADVELKIEDTTETPLIQEVQAETESIDMTKKKKKKKHSLSATMEEEQPSAPQEETQAEPLVTKKKKKNRDEMHEINDSIELSSMQEADVSVTKKKKRKKSKQETDEVEENIVTAETETQADISVTLDASMVDDGQKKRKKKKKKEKE